MLSALDEDGDHDDVCDERRLDLEAMRIGSAVQPSAAPSINGTQPRLSDHQQHDITLVERVVDDLAEVGSRRNVIDVEEDVVFSTEPAKAKMIAVELPPFPGVCV